MRISNIGVLGTGLWDGEIVTNEQFGLDFATTAAIKDPYRGRRSDDGTIRIAGMEFTPERYPRTLAALERCFVDPYRGARRRRYFPSHLKVSDAETEAARHAMADAGVTAAQIGAVLVQSFLPDVVQPKNAALVAHNLGIRHAPAWEVDSICNSALTHFAVGASLITSGLAQHVLCVQSTAYSRVSDPGSSSRVQEGDMASAFVLGPSPGTRAACAFRTDGRLHAAINLHWGPPAGAPPRRWWEPAPDRLQVGFEPDLQAQVMAEVAENARTVCEEALRRAELRADEIDILISHQPMSWNRAFMEDVLGLREGVAFDTFEEYGTINSAGIPASIHVAREQDRLRPGSRVLFFGPGAGYTFAAIALHWGGGP